jgi:hypothetical protein
MASLLDEIYGVRSVLANPLEQSPSVEDIVEALQEVYQFATNRTNNTGNGWQINTTTIVALEGVFVYEISTPFNDFYKALSVVTIPENDDPEYALEFVEVEHIPTEWQWVTEQGGTLYGSSTHSGRYIAFYRKMGTDGETIWCEIRPVPAQDENYKITYQVGDWWERVTSTDYEFPHKEFKFHLRRLAASTLLPKCRWSYDANANRERKLEIGATLDRAIEMGAPAFDAHIASLDQANVVELETYSDY